MKLGVPLLAALPVYLAVAVAVAPAAVEQDSAAGDTLTGRAGADVLLGGDGRDDVYGAGGRDVLRGGAGADQLLGGPGADVMSGGQGPDQLHADDGETDVVSCGPGVDTFFRERRDVIARDCELDGRRALQGGALATFAVGRERFRAWVTNPTTIWQLRELAAGRSSSTIPAGTLRRGPGDGQSNAPYSWHLDPRDTTMADFTIELCDATPSHVESHLDEFVDVVRAYCPWSARLLELRNYGGRAQPLPAPSPPVGELPGAP